MYVPERAGRGPASIWHRVLCAWKGTGPKSFLIAELRCALLRVHTAPVASTRLALRTRLLRQLTASHPHKRAEFIENQAMKSEANCGGLTQPRYRTPRADQSSTTGLNRLLIRRSTNHFQIQIAVIPATAWNYAGKSCARGKKRRA